jgi:FMN phosphatase YigB (HAD superfamily)
MHPHILFIDDGGVMSDNRLRSEQWQRMVAGFFAPRLGGSPEAWADANRQVITAMLEAQAWEKRCAAYPDYASFERDYFLDWLRVMCEIVGVGCPPDEESLALSREITAYIIPRIRAAYPGAADTVRLLHRRGYTLYTASGEASYDLEGYLQGMGVRDCFTTLYGPDLINAFKTGPEFYRRILAHGKIDPAEGLLVDNYPGAISWAGEVGLRGVLVNSDGDLHSSEALATIGSLSELPALLQQLEHLDDEA